MRKGKYLFFDIECSNGRDICSFGYCLFDEKLHLLEKRDILINPEKNFLLHASGKRPKIELSYPVEAFYKQDNFKYFYNTIKSLLVDNGYKLFGHSCKSDFAFLNMACLRYALEPMQFCAFDTQLLYKVLYNRPHVESLESIMNNLEIDTSRVLFHKSCDDAYASYLVVKEICYLLDKDIETLVSENANCLLYNNGIFQIKKNNKYKIKKTVDKGI